MFLLRTCNVYVFWTSLGALISEIAKMNNPVAKSDWVFKSVKSAGIRDMCNKFFDLNILSSILVIPPGADF